jgi:hypothetical protein
MMVPNNEDADLCLSELTENSLMISNTHEVAKFNHNHALTNTNKGGLYSNELSTMTTATKGGNGRSSNPSSTTHDSSESSDAMAAYTSSLGPLGASSPLAMPQTGVGLLVASFPDSWNDWESKRRSESVSHHHANDNNYWKKHHKNANPKRIQRKSVSAKKVKVPALVNFRRRRKLERSIGRHLRDSCLKRPVVLPPMTIQESELECNINQCGIVPFQSSKSLRRQRPRRRVVRFREEEIDIKIADGTLEWKREQHQQQKGLCFGRGLGSNKNVGTETPFLEAHRERKQNQRALLDLQVGMKCMDL